MTEINLTQQQRTDVQKHSRYRDGLSIAVVDQGIYWNGNDGTATPTAPGLSDWYKHRSVAEGVLADTNALDINKWISLATPRLKEESITMDETTFPPEVVVSVDNGKNYAVGLDVEFILNAMVADKTFDVLASVAYDEEAKGVPF